MSQLKQFDLLKNITKSPKGAPVSKTPGNTGSLILSTEFNSGINPGPKEFGGNLIRGILNTNNIKIKP